MQRGVSEGLSEDILSFDLTPFVVKCHLVTPQSFRFCFDGKSPIGRRLTANRLVLRKHVVSDNKRLVKHYSELSDGESHVQHQYALSDVDLLVKRRQALSDVDLPVKHR